MRKVQKAVNVCIGGHAQSINRTAILVGLLGTLTVLVTQVQALLVLLGSVHLPRWALLRKREKAQQSILSWIDLINGVKKSTTVQRLLTLMCGIRLCVCKCLFAHLYYTTCGMASYVLISLILVSLIAEHCCYCRFNFASKLVT